MAMAASAEPAAHLPEEIIVWEILVRLPPKSLLRCRSVSRAWRQATSSRDFLLAHHSRQPSLPVVSSHENRDSSYENIHIFDPRAAQLLQPVARLASWPKASCDGLLVLSKRGACFFVCNPVTRQHAPIRQLSGFSVLGMYRHRPTGEYRLLLRSNFQAQLPQNQIECYVLGFGSDQPPMYIGGLDVAALAYLHTPALLRDSLHWYPVQYRSDPSKLVIVFDTTSESFRWMRAPVVPTMSYIFEMDATLGIYSYNEAMRAVDIWVLHNYEGEVWYHKHHIELPVVEIMGQFGSLFADSWDVSAVSVDGDVLLLVCNGGWMFYVDVDGEVVDNFRHDGQILYACDLRMKQTLVHHTFFTQLEGYVVDDSPFVLGELVLQNGPHAMN